MENNHNQSPSGESIWAALSRPFAFNDIHVKVLATNRDKTRGLVVPYVDARAVMDRLDEVAGTERWSDSYDVLEGGSVRCTLTIIGSSKQDCGQGDDYKSAFSDALKRAAVKFGIGRHLYDAEKLWGPLDEKGQLSNPEEAKRRILGPPPNQSRGESRINPGPARNVRPVSLPTNGDLPF